jgi:hypothetical protein
MTNISKCNNSQNRRCWLSTIARLRLLSTCTGLTTTRHMTSWCHGNRTAYSDRQYMMSSMKSPNGLLSEVIQAILTYV